jgi:hypothetical protein
MKVVPMDSKDSDNLSPSFLLKLFLFCVEKEKDKTLNKNLINSGGS